MLCVTAAEAQVIGPPRRVFQRQPDTGRLRQELTLETDLLGGRDDNLSPQSGQEFLPQPSGYTGYAVSRVRYFVGRRTRSFEARGGGFVNSFRNVGVKPSYGGDLELQGQTELGRRTELRASQSVRSNPYFGLGAFSALQPTVPDTVGLETGGFDSGPTRRLSEIRSLALDTSASVRREWTARATTEFRYGFNDTTYHGDLLFDSRRHAGEFIYDQAIGRYAGLETSYRYSDVAFIDDFDASPVPTTDQTLHVGFRYGRDLTRTRRVEVGAGVGPTYTDTLDQGTRLPRQFWAPSGYGRARIDLSRDWTLNANYLRSVTVLYGATPEAFLADAASISLGGSLVDRIGAVLSGAYSNGQGGVIPEVTGPGRFYSYTLSGQMSFLVTEWWSALVNYTHYRYTLNTVASQTLGVPSNLNRNTMYVGFSLRVPLVGTVPSAVARRADQGN